MKIENILYGILNTMLVASIIFIVTVSHIDAKDRNDKMLEEIAKANAALIDSIKNKTNKCNK